VIAKDKEEGELHGMIKLYTFDAGKGDCLLLRYQGKSGKKHNILVDSGTSRFKNQLSQLEKKIIDDGEQIDYVIITHVDNDHLGGLLSLERHGTPLRADEFVINHPDAGPVLDRESDTPLSARENNELYNMLSKRGAAMRGAVRGDVICLDGAKLYITGPTQERLNNIFGSMAQDTPLGGGSDGGAGLETLMASPLPARDTSANNAASIVFVFEYLGVRLLFTGDGLPEDILDGLRTCGLARAEDGRIRFDAVKLPHHGSARNISEEMPSIIDAHRFIICADGSQHPDKLTVAKLLKWYGTVEVFSGRSWWDRDFVTREDRERFVEAGKLHFCEAERGDVLTW